MDDIYEMTYKITKKDKKIRILGEKFVLRNKNRCHLIYQNKKYQLQKDLIIEVINIEKIKLKIIGLSSVIDFSYMFQGCRTLVSFDKYNIELKEKKIEQEDES